jgi:ABC-type multidrug transport system, ATPase and permease components
MCTDFIRKLENKFQTVIGENGVKLSGGEKQNFR